MAYQRADVDGRRAVGQRLGVVIELGKAELGGVQQVQWRLGCGGHQRHQRQAAIAGDHGGHALGKFGQHARVAQHLRIVMRVHVDEAGCQRQALAVNHFISAGRQIRSHAGNAVAANQYIGLARGRASAIDHLDVAQQGAFHDSESFSIEDQAQSTAGCWSMSWPWACKTDLNWLSWRAAFGPSALSTSTMSSSITSK